MTVFWNKDRQRWSYNFMVRGQRYQGYCVDARTSEPVATKRAAKAIEADLKAALRKSGTGGQPLPSSYTLAMALDAFVAGLDKASSYYDDQLDFVAELASHFGPATPIEDVDDARIAAYVIWGLAQPLRTWIGGPTKRPDPRDPKNWRVRSGTRSKARMNRYLTCLRAVLNKAHHTRNPVTGQPMLPFPPKVPELEEPKRIPRPVPNEALQRILPKAAQHVVEAAILANHFPMRQFEIATRTVHDVDHFERAIRIRGEDAKGNRDELLPASDRAWAFLEFLVAQARRRGTDFLIAWKPRGGSEWQPVKNWYKAWMAAQRRAGIARAYRFHDNKASFSTNLRRRKASKEEVQGASRHKYPSTTERYMAVVDDNRRELMERLADETVTTEFMKRLIAKGE